MPVHNLEIGREDKGNKSRHCGLESESAVHSSRAKSMMLETQHEEDNIETVSQRREVKPWKELYRIIGS